MKKHGKKYIKARNAIVSTDTFSMAHAIEKVKELAFAKFDESVDVHVNLNIDPTKGELSVRGSMILPNKLGKNVRILVFAKGPYVQQALDAGADYAGGAELIEKIQSGWLDFDYAVSTPDMMGSVGVLAKLLGPRGLLPNKKNGTVTFDVGAVVSDLKKGRTFFKNDKSGLVHTVVGKVSFGSSALEQNISSFIHALQAARPAKAKGRFIKKVTLASTMGVGVAVNVDELMKL